jgi:hypothetical protein
MPEFKNKAEYEKWKADRIKAGQESQNGKSQEVTLKTKDDRMKKIIFYYLIAFIISIFVVIVVKLTDGPTKHLEQEADRYASVETYSYHFFAGDKAFMNGKFALIASDEDSFEELGKIATANDKIGAERLVLSGRAFIEDGHVEVLIIETKSNTARIRILEGRNYGRDGWIYTKFLSKQ